MAEGIDPFEIRPYEPVNTTDEITDNTDRFTTPPPSPSGTIHIDGTDFTPVRGNLASRYKNDRVGGLYDKLSKESKYVKGKEPDAMYTDLFDFKEGKLYYIDRYKNKELQLTTKGRLKTIGQLDSLIGKNRLKDMGFDISNNEVTSEQAAELNEINNEVPSTSDIDNANYIELQNIADRLNKSIENVINMVTEIDEPGLTLK